MAVPNSNSFSMQDVVDFLRPPTTTPKLSDLIAQANAENYSRWDPDYSGARDSLYNFRNFGGRKGGGGGSQYTGYRVSSSNSYDSQYSYTTTSGNRVNRYLSGRTAKNICAQTNSVTAELGVTISESGVSC